MSDAPWYRGVNKGQMLAMLAAFMGWMFDGFEMGLHPLVARPALVDLLGDNTKAELRAEVAKLPDSPAKARVNALLDGPIDKVYSDLTKQAEPDKTDPVDLEIPKATRDGFKKILEAPISFWNGINNFLFLVGAATGGLVFGWLGDRVGRTKAMIWSVLAYTVFTGLGGFATEAWHLAAFRFIAALGMGGEWSLGVALVMEIWPSNARPYLAGFIGAAANVGFLLIAVVGIGLQQFVKDNAGGWRWLMFVGVTPALLTFFIRMFVPESHKWEEAVATAGEDGVKRGPSASAILGELFGSAQLKRLLVGIGLSSVALLATWGAVQWMPLWVDKMQEGLAQRDPLAKNFVQIASSIGAIVGTMAAALLAGRFGRRPAYVVLCLSSLAAAMWTFRPAWLMTPLGIDLPAMEYGPLFLFSVLLVGMTTASFYGWIPLYLPELFPTRIRATGQGIAFNFGRIFAGLGNLFATAPLITYFSSDYAQAMAAVTCIYIVGLVIIWFGPETHGKPLPD